MKALTYIEHGKFALLDKPEPEIIDPRDAIVRVTLGSICTSDLHIKHGSVPRAVPGITVGHEMVGVVESVGAAVKTVRPGDRVTVNVETFCGECYFCQHGWVNNCTDPDGGWALGCRIDGGQAELVRVPYADQGLNKIPDSVTDEQALFVGDILATGFWAAKISEIKSEDTVLIIGAGPTGICTLLCAALKDPKRIIACEKDPARLAFVRAHYRDLSSLKKIADNHGICIFLVHHTRKDRDSNNIFNDMTGSTGIMGVADTVMILRKEERFGDVAALCITGRDVEEKKLKMQMCGVRWEITEELNADDLRRERIPDFVYEVVEFLFEHSKFQGTATELLAAVGNTKLKPNIASKYLTRYYSEVFLPMGISYEYRKTAAARLIILELHDDADGHDDASGSEGLASQRAENDGTAPLPLLPSQPSSASQREVNEDEVSQC